MTHFPSYERPSEDGKEEDADTHLSFEQIRGKAFDLAANRRQARRNYQQAVEEAATAEAYYRKNLAIHFATHRAEKGAGESEVLAQGDTSRERYQRDIAQGKMKAALLRIEELEADRAMLRQLGTWSQELEVHG